MDGEADKRSRLNGFGRFVMKKTYWLDALVLELPLEAIPSLRMHVEIKNWHSVETPDGIKRFCLGHEAAGATELGQYVERLKVELDSVVAKAKRHERAYDAKLRLHRKS